MSVTERKAMFEPRKNEGKRPKLGLKFGSGETSARPLPRVEGAR
jgi:hypothetical protein